MTPNTTKNETMMMQGGAKIDDDASVDELMAQLEAQAARIQTKRGSTKGTKKEKPTLKDPPGWRDETKARSSRKSDKMKAMSASNNSNLSPAKPFGDGSASEALTGATGSLTSASSAGSSKRRSSSSNNNMDGSSRVRRNSIDYSENTGFIIDDNNTFDSEISRFEDELSMSQLEQDIRAKQQGRRPSSKTKPGAVAVAGGGSGRTRPVSRMEQDILAKQRGMEGSQREMGSSSRMSQSAQDIRTKESSRRRGSASRPGAVAVSGRGDSVRRMEQDLLTKERRSSGAASRPGAVAVSGRGDSVRQMEQDLLTKESRAPAAAAARPGAVAVSGRGDSVRQMEQNLLGKEPRSSGVASMPGAVAVSGGDSVRQIQNDLLAKGSGEPASRFASMDGSSGESVVQMEQDLLAKGRRGSAASRPGAVSVSGGDSVTQMEHTLLAKGSGGVARAMDASGGDSVRQMERNLLGKEPRGSSVASLPGATAVSGGDSVRQMEHNLLAKGRSSSARHVSSNDSVRMMEHDLLAKGRSSSSRRFRAEVDVDQMEEDYLSRGGESYFTTASGGSSVAVTQMEQDILTKERMRRNGPSSVSQIEANLLSGYHAPSVRSASSGRSTRSMRTIATQTELEMSQIQSDMMVKQGLQAVAESKYHQNTRAGAQKLDVSAHDAMNKGQKLVEAKPVKEEDEPVAAAMETVGADEEVGLEAQEEHEAKARRNHNVWKCKVTVCFFLVLVGVALGAFFAMRSTSDKAITEGAKIEVDGTIIVTETQQPSPAPTPFIIDIPASTMETIMQDPESPQAKAYRWISNDPYLDQYVGQEDRLVQRFALATVYYSLEGENWPTSNGWMDYNMSECEWAYRGGYGLPALEMKGLVTERFVSTMVDNAVTGEPFDWKTFLYTDDLVPPPLPSCNPKNQFKLLRIHRQNLQGTIPEELALLSTLVVLDISYNDGLIGTMPTTFGQMDELKYVMMEETGISGTIPSEIGDMECLRVLSTTGTEFWSGTTIPSEMGRLTDLTTLLFAFSGVEGTIPPELANAHNLTILDVSSRAEDNRRISGTIPTEFAKLSKLAVFTCGNCDLEGTLPNELGQLGQLQMLSLGPSDSITGSIPSSFGGMSSLKYINIAHSQLQGQIPPELGSATDLVRMYLMDNELTGTLPSDLGRMTSLATAYINDNAGLGGEIPSELVSSWGQSLFKLDIKGTEITGIMPPSFCDLPGYFEFDCSWKTCGCNCVCTTLVP